MNSLGFAFEFNMCTLIAYTTDYRDYVNPNPKQPVSHNTILHGTDNGYILRHW